LPRHILVKLLCIAFRLGSRKAIRDAIRFPGPILQSFFGPLWFKASLRRWHIEVHRLKGPGLIKSIYERCLMRMILTGANRRNVGGTGE
jgi:hypothetical protein